MKSRDRMRPTQSFRTLVASLLLPLLVTPFMSPGLKAGKEPAHLLVAAQPQQASKRAIDFLPNDPFLERLDADNQSVINHFGFHALYELMVWQRRMLRGAKAAGIEVINIDQPKSSIPDAQWFRLINTSPFLNMLYPVELKEIRIYGFNAFKLANERGIALEDHFIKSLSDRQDRRKLFSEGFALNREEQTDELIDQFNQSGKWKDKNPSNYEDIALDINDPEEITPKAVSFLVTYITRLFLAGAYEDSLSVSKKLFDLAIDKWGDDRFKRLQPTLTLLSQQGVARSMSNTGRGEFAYDLPDYLSGYLDDAVSATEYWWGPDTIKLIELLTQKAEFLEQDQSLGREFSIAERISLLTRVEDIYARAKQDQLFLGDENQEIAADRVMARVAMMLLNADVERGEHDSAYKRIVRFKAYKTHPGLDDNSLSFGILFSDLVNKGKYAQMIEIAERLISSFENKQIVLDDKELSDLRLALANCYVYVGRFDEFESLLPELDQSNGFVKMLRVLSKVNQGVLPDLEYPLPSLAFTPNNFDFEMSALQYMVAMIVESANKNYPESIAAGEALYSAVVANPSSIKPQDVSKVLSATYFSSGNRASGLDYLRKTVMHIDQQSDDASLDAQIGIPRLKLSLFDQQFDESRDKGKAIFDLWLGQLQTELARMPLQERTAYLQSLLASIQDTEALNLLLSDRTFLATSPDLPLFYVLNRKGLLEELERRQRGLLNADPSAQAIVQNLRGKQKRVADGAVRGEELNALQLEINALERQLYRVLPNLQPRTFSVQEVSQALPSDGALVEYVRFQWADPVDPLNTKLHYAAFVLKPNARVSVVQLGEAEVIDSSIANAVDALEQQFSDSEVLLQKALDRVLLPLRSELSGVRALYLSPDGELNRLPFAAASFDGGTSFLADQVDLRIVTTGRELLQLQTGKVTAISPAVVVANPAFDRAGAAAAKQPPKGSGSSSNQDSPSSSGTQRALGLDQIWPPLQYTQEEGQNTSDLLGGSLFTGNQATTANIKATLSPLVAHFATHGYFMPDEQRTQSDPLAVASILPIKTQGSSAASNPLLRSGIVMAGANQPDADPNDDGYLTALEVLQLDWSGTELVVVSACESGRGLVKRGEGMYGLKRAFAVAGARSSLLSLWKVDDQATAAFMQSFYQRLKEGKGKGDALAETQHEFRTHPIAGWRHPYVWAAFQLSGDWGPVKGL